jgi:nitrate/TMAO reductase-like tetraheme cytochrome c subunit
MSKSLSENKRLEWKRLVEEQRQSGLSIQKWCQQQHLTLNTFHYWKGKLSSKELLSSSFVELKVKRPDEISLQTRGLHIRVSNDCDPVLRKQLLTLFAEAAC